MTFSTQDFHTLLDDKHTVISMATNNTGVGEYIIVMNGFVRPQSPLKDKFLNPHRNISNIPPQYVRSCPRCEGDWEALTYDIKNGKMQNTHYICSAGCGVSICSLTFDKFARYHSPEAVDQLLAEQDAQDIEDNRMTEEEIVFSEFEGDLHEEIADLIDAQPNLHIPSVESNSMTRAAEDNTMPDLNTIPDLNTMPTMNTMPDLFGTSQSTDTKNKEE
tara:strand:- start:3658 stop:4311 length:654 start_codon:yes stop_codon:yes gene_type:complete